MTVDAQRRALDSGGVALLEQQPQCQPSLLLETTLATPLPRLSSASRRHGKLNLWVSATLSPCLEQNLTTAT